MSAVESIPSLTRTRRTLPDLNCEGPDLENMLLAQRKDFWHLLDRTHKEGVKKGFTELEDVLD